jgi:hypothetical protein
MIDHFSLPRKFIIFFSLFQVKYPPRRRGGFDLCANPSMAPQKSPQPPFTKGGHQMGYLTCNKSSSPFGKGGPRGILLRLPE